MITSYVTTQEHDALKGRVTELESLLTQHIEMTTKASKQILRIAEIVVDQQAQIEALKGRVSQA